MHRMLHRNVVAGVLTILLSAGLLGAASPMASATATGAGVAPSTVATYAQYTRKSTTYKRYRSYRYYRTYRTYRVYRYVNGRLTYRTYRAYYWKRVYKRTYRSYKAYRTTMRQTSGNHYYRGYCTWYAFERRRAMGRPVGGSWHDAKYWAGYARSAGYTVNHTPRVGAVMVKTSGAWGHVAVVERVNADGSWTVSEMNVRGWNRVSSRTFSRAAASSYWFIH